MYIERKIQNPGRHNLVSLMSWQGRFRILAGTNLVTCIGIIINNRGDIVFRQSQLCVFKVRTKGDQEFRQARTLRQRHVNNTGRYSIRTDTAVCLWRNDKGDPEFSQPRTLCHWLVHFTGDTVFRPTQPCVFDVPTKEIQNSGRQNNVSLT